jgi:hypothetical protein
MTVRTTTIQRAVAALLKAHTHAANLFVTARPVSWIGTGRALVLHAGAFVDLERSTFQTITPANILERWQIAPAPLILAETAEAPVTGTGSRSRPLSQRGRRLAADLEADHPGLVALSTLAARYGVHPATIRRRAKAAGVELVKVRGNFMVPADRADQVATWTGRQAVTVQAPTVEQQDTTSSDATGDTSPVWY